MKSPIIQDSKKPNETPTVQKNTLTKFQKLLMPGLLITGFIIGWSLNHLAVCKNPSDAETKKLKSDTNQLDNDNEKISNSKYPFINPYVLTPAFDRIYSEELTNFKGLIEQYCATAKKDKSIKQISVYFRDLTNGLWIGVNEKEKFIPASLSKVPLLIAVFQKADSNPEYLQKKLTYKGSDAATYLDAHPEIDDIRTSLTVSESYTIEYLTDVMITKSDNEATMLILKDIGIDYLTNLQKRLGYQIPVNASSATNIISVKNYSSFFRILYNASLLSRKYSEKALEILSRTEYDKGIRRAIPSTIRISQKYGERDTLISPTKLQIQQLHQASIVYYSGKPFFICIMTKGSDKLKMEDIIYDVSKIIYDQVDQQTRKFKHPLLLEDIN